MVPLKKCSYYVIFKKTLFFKFAITKISAGSKHKKSQLTNFVKYDI